MRVIVAEDEKWVRATIIKTIPFDELGLTLVCEASNGIEALELCSRHKPDILITDIMMPGLSGLDLIEKLYKTIPEIKIVIISGYSDFEYAKTAIKFGVCEYLLKPVDKLEISRVLSIVKQNILDGKKKVDETNFYKVNYTEMLPIIHENFLSALIQNNQFTSYTIKTQLVKNGIRFNFSNFKLIVFTPDTSTFLCNEENISYLRTLISKVINRYLQGITFLKLGSENHFISIINFDPKLYNCHETVNNPSNTKLLSIDDVILKAVKLCSSIFEKRFKSNLTIGLSSSGSTLTNFPQLYSQALEALSLRFWDPSKNFFIFNPDFTLNNIKINLADDTIDNIAFEIKLSNINPAFKYVENICNDANINSIKKPVIIKEFLWSFVQAIIFKLNMQLSFLQNDSGFSDKHPYEIIRNAKTIDELIKHIKELIEIICTFYLNNNKVNNANVMETAWKIINESFHMDLSLENVARQVFLSPAYFSELFKKETGMSFIDYKTHLRIENAKKLISSTNLNVSEIGSRVGYTDPKYFSKLFKKITGSSPNEFKGKNK